MGVINQINIGEQGMNGQRKGKRRKDQEPEGRPREQTGRPPLV